MRAQHQAVLPSPAAMRGRRRLRVLHCPWNVAGQSAQLAAAERALGADSRCIVFEEIALGFPADKVLVPSKASIVQREAARWRLLWQAMTWADVVHFYFGQSCLVPNAYPSLDQIGWLNPLRAAWQLYCRSVWLKDLPLLSGLGKVLAVTWQGDDVRQNDRSQELFDISIAKELGEAYYVPGSDEWKRRCVAAFARNVPIQYALNPDLLHVLPASARFMPYASFDPKTVTPLPPDPSNTGNLVFAHAPSHRGAKGTEHVLAAAEILRSEGLRFELRLIEGRTRKKALEAYSICDVVIDQLLAGWYGGLGVEAMALAKPVIAYLREGDLEFVPSDIRQSLPIARASVQTIAQVMRSFVAMPRGDLFALGTASRAFAERFHDPLTIAAGTLGSYQRELARFV